MSDTHTYGRRIAIPDGDVLIHAGDLTFHGDEAEISEALAWLASLPHRHKVFVAGNHGWFFDPNMPSSFRGRRLERHRSVEALLADFPTLTYLQDSAVTIAGFNVWGSPWQPNFYDWAFNFPHGDYGVAAARHTWAAIPDDTHVLITHGPPLGILDTVYSQTGDTRAGDRELRDRVCALRELRLHVFGHLHESYGRFEEAAANDRPMRTFVNAAVNTRQYERADRRRPLDEWSASATASECAPRSCAREAPLGTPRERRRSRSARSRRPAVARWIRTRGTYRSSDSCRRHSHGATIPLPCRTKRRFLSIALKRSRMAFAAAEALPIDRGADRIDHRAARSCATPSRSKRSPRLGCGRRRTSRGSPPCMLRYRRIRRRARARRRMCVSHADRTAARMSQFPRPNELDVVRRDATIAARHGADVRASFARLEARFPMPARRAWRADFGTLQS